MLTIARRVAKFFKSYAVTEEYSDYFGSKSASAAKNYLGYQTVADTALELWMQGLHQRYEQAESGMSDRPKVRYPDSFELK